MRLAVVTALMLAVTPAFATDAVTYKGTLGKYPVLVELTDPGADLVAGRYSYLAKGGDIPLDATQRQGDTIVLAEEAPCTETTCMQDDQGNIAEIPVGASWRLTLGADGALTGSWQPIGKGKALDVALTEIGRRHLPDDAERAPLGLYNSVTGQLYGEAADAFGKDNPYDQAKLAVPLEQGPVKSLDGSSYRFVTDPRSKFGFPRIVDLADGSSPEVINAVLTQRQNTISSYAFDCLSQIYAGFGGNQYSAGMGAGTLGDYDAEYIEVNYLSPTVMDWTESGSTFCGGAYPNNHSDNFILDVKTGKPLALAKVFKDWVARNKLNDYSAAVDQAAAREMPQDYRWAPGQPLIDYVLANLVPSDDADYEAECGINDLIATNLGVRFASGDMAVFMLVDLPHVIFACGDDLLTVPLADIPQLLAPTAREYFPALPD